MKKRALVSVSDKTNLIPFVEGLVECGYEIISTGGTYKVLTEAGVDCLSIEEVTHFPEILDGRVKTLHPLVHGGLLAVRDLDSHQEQMKKNHIETIDLVCVNLYPFKQTISKEGFTHAEAIENIDIGGPSMLRSAAKNHRYVSVVCDVNDYDVVLKEIRENGDTTLKTRQRLAAKVYRKTASYDAMIAEYMTQFVEEENPESLTMTFDLKQTLRYGENPHQKASFYSEMFTTPYSMCSAVQLHGKELSYNNIQDANATLEMLRDFEGQSAVVAVKHMNPCGIGVADDLYTAWRKAYEADTTSIFGGIVAFNETMTVKIAEELSQMFLEIILAPAYEEKALEILSRKKNIRLMTYQPSAQKENLRKFVAVSGGVLVQDTDRAVTEEKDCKCVTEKQPTSEEMKDMLFGFKVVKHVKSNAIVIVKDGQTLGIGAGQMNRVGAAKIALEQAKDKAKGAVLASDAFFPMDDTVELAASYGITAIIQPGGSIKDEDSIVACNKNQMSMVFTGKRHFKH